MYVCKARLKKIDIEEMKLKTEKVYWVLFYKKKKFIASKMFIFQFVVDFFKLIFSLMHQFFSLAILKSNIHGSWRKGVSFSIKNVYNYIKIPRRNEREQRLTRRVFALFSLRRIIQRRKLKFSQCGSVIPTNYFY